MIARYIILCFTFMFISSQVFAQSSTSVPNDLSRVKVEELSDDQIRQILERAEESGMSEAQIKSALLARGLPASELRKLEERINSLDRGRAGTVATNNRGRVVIESNRDDIFSSLSGDTKAPRPDTVPQSRIFGYNLFRNSNLTFEPSLNIPTPPNYQIGPGDEIIIDIWGASQQNYQLPVSPEGTIFIENLGPIQVNGLTIDQASERIIGRLKNIYSGLSGPGRNTYAEITLGNIRTIDIHILGEVNMPGTFTLSSFATVFNALYASGGPSRNGSFREIELFRNNELIATIDMYDFLIDGKQDNNIRLQDQDIIKVNPYINRVDLNGEIKREGLYEMNEGETFKDLIRFSGGFTDMAYQKRLTIYRKTDTERKIVDLNKEEFTMFTFHDGDSIVVAPILNRYENRVTINGAVFRPGEYAINGGLTLKELIVKAEGLREDAFLSRALIYRTRDDFTLEVIPANLRQMQLNEAEDIPLVKNDVVSVSSIFDLREEYFFEIEGAVNHGGIYPFMEGTSLEDLVVMAGGLTEGASASRIEVARRHKVFEGEEIGSIISELYYFDINRNLELTDEADKFILKPFDQVFIRISPGYEEPRLVTVEGEVLYPGRYSLTSKEERISDIIERSGGLTNEAYPEGARLYRRVEIDQEERKKALESLMEDSSDSLVLNIDEDPEQAIGIELKKILDAPGGKHDILVRKNDRIVISKELQTVRLSGALLYPITVRYDKSYGFNKYISMSGGFANDAKRGKSYVIYANGSIDKTTNLLLFNLYPRIEPGAEIVIPRKPEKQKMSPQEAIGISSALTSMALIIVTIINSFGGT